MEPNISVQQAALRSAIAAGGWEIAAVERPDDWWCHERWRLRSVWSPRDREAFVTFLIDPESQTAQLQRGDYRVWAAVASAAPLTQWQRAPNDGTVSLARKWESQVPVLIEYLAKVRSNNSLEAGRDA